MNWQLIDMESDSVYLKATYMGVLYSLFLRTEWPNNTTWEVQLTSNNGDQCFDSNLLKWDTELKQLTSRDMQDVMTKANTHIYSSIEDCGSEMKGSRI